jgi:hypothetical protein
MKRLTFQEILEGPVQRSWLNEAAVDFSVRECSVDFVVKETATERARRRWKLNEDVSMEGSDEPTTQQDDE